MPSNELVLRGVGNLPVPRPSAFQAVRQARALQRHAADMEFKARRETINILATAAVARTGIKEGLEMLVDGREQAGDDPGGDWIVAEFVSTFTECARARFVHEFAPQVWP